MAKDLTTLSDEQLSNEWSSLNMDSQYYQDREADYDEDRSGELDAIHAEMDAISDEQMRRFKAESVHYDNIANENELQRVMEAA
jgi:hypothetical protein